MTRELVALSAVIETSSGAAPAEPAGPEGPRFAFPVTMEFRTLASSSAGMLR